MIYVLGDSFSFGYNFWKEGKNPKELVYGHHLSQKLNVPLTNLSIPAGSNWRIARLLSTLSLNEDDIVIIGWSAIERFEIPTNKTALSPLDKVFDTHDQRLGSEPIPNQFLQYVEKTDNVYTRRLVFNIFDGEEKVYNKHFQKLQQSLYTDFYNLQYYNEMFFILYKACLFQLQLAKAKFLMFNSWSSTITLERKEFDIKQYLYGTKSNMTDNIRKGEKSKYNHNYVNYWTEDEHEQIAEILYSKLKEYYNIA